MPTSTLTDAQQAAASSDSALILCVAGPGSGKTRTLVSRIQRLLQTTDPRRIVALTFTNAAARELTERLGQPIGFCGTLHSFMLRLLQRYGSQIGYQTSQLGVVDAEQAEELLERAIKDTSCRASKKKVLSALGALNEPGDMDSADIAAMRYRSLLLGNGLLSFDLVLSEGLRLAKQLTDLPYDHLLVDEYQDSSAIDAEIYQALPITNKFFVGDGDQSIFGFRGGQVQNILDLCYQPGVEEIQLDRNYRSDQSICRAAQRLIQHAPNRIPKGMVSHTDAEGQTDLLKFRAADVEKAGISHVLRDLPGSAAVLLRYNQQVDNWVTYLEGVGLPVVRRSAQSKPADWRFCRDTIALLNDPENDLLAYWFVRAKHDPAQADKLRLQAASQGVPLNDLGLNIPLGLPLASYGQILARCGVSPESLALVEQARALLAPDATGPDLLIALSQTEDSQSEEGQGIIVCTYHAAKGREWDTVVLPEFEEGILPGAKADSLEEDRRLAYVGMTRARHRLVVSYCDERAPMWGDRRARPVRPSRFIQEAGL